MAFLATPSFYSTNATHNLLLSGSGGGTMLMLPATTVLEAHHGVESMDVQQHKSQQHLDPFDPKASVPLPHQLEDQFGPFTTSVWKRNERERYRVKCVNDGYEQLRVHLPLADGDKRISKVDTLRLAVRYIKHLDALLNTVDHASRCRCFHRFKEESEGNVAVALRPSGERLRR